LGDEEGAVQVDVDHGAPVVKGEVLSRRGGSTDTRVVDQHVEAAELVSDVSEQAVDGGGVADGGDRAGGVLVGVDDFSHGLNIDVTDVHAGGEGARSLGRCRSRRR
jgi:hypothetical protein